jgi:hypothetical protein
MKRFLLTALLLAVSSAAVAQYYEPIPYYGNNPYIFCTVRVPQDCWAPISKELGTPMPVHNEKKPLVTGGRCFTSLAFMDAVLVSGMVGARPPGHLGLITSNRNES